MNEAGRMQLTVLSSMTVMENGLISRGELTEGTMPGLRLSLAEW